MEKIQPLLLLPAATERSRADDCKGWRRWPKQRLSLEPHEFKAMVEAIRTAEKALGEVRYEVGKQEAKSRVFRRSLFVVKDMKAGEVFTEENVRSIRPGYGLPPKFLKEVLGRRAACDIKKGTPLKWRLIC